MDVTRNEAQVLSDFEMWDRSPCHQHVKRFLFDSEDRADLVGRHQSVELRRGGLGAATGGVAAEWG
jgi:hypothetical protein